MGERQIGTLSVPGSIVGMSAPTVRLPEYYQIHLIYYVDPVTGALLNVNEHQTTSLRNPATGAQALLLFDADLIATPASVTNIVALDTGGRNKLNLIETIGSAADAAPSTEPTVTEPVSGAPAKATAEAPAEHSIVPGMAGGPPDR